MRLSVGDRINFSSFERNSRSNLMLQICLWWSHPLHSVLPRQWCSLRRSPYLLLSRLSLLFPCHLRLTWDLRILVYSWPFIDYLFSEYIQVYVLPGLCVPLCAETTSWTPSSHRDLLSPHLDENRLQWLESVYEVVLAHRGTQRRGTT